MSKQIGVGVIGLGIISQAHLKTIVNNKNLKLIAVSDRDVQKAETVAKRYRCKFFVDNMSLIEDPEIELVVLLTPPGFYEKLIPACALNGKHVMAEKPVGTNMDKINSYLKLCKEKGIKLSIVSQHRFDTSSIYAKSKIDEGVLGNISIANCIVNWYRNDEYYDSWHNNREMAGGGVLAIQAIHTIDLLLWFLGDVHSVKGCTTRIRKKDIDVEDTAAASIRFVNGSLAVISATTCAYPGMPARLEILGDQGSITIEGENLLLRTLNFGSDSITYNENNEVSYLNPGKISTKSLNAQYEDLVQAIKRNIDPLVSGEEAKKTYQVIDAIYQSCRTGKEIKLSELEEAKV